MANPTTKALLSPPSSPDQPAKKTTSNKKHGQVQPTSPLTPNTPLVDPKNNKRPAPSPSSSNSSQHGEPQHKGKRIKTSADNNGNKQLVIRQGGSGSGSGSSSSSVPLLDHDLIGNMEQMVKMLKMVSGVRGLMSDPVLACLVSAQTVVMACTAELISRRDHHSKGSSSSINRAANGVVEKKMKNNVESNKYIN